MERVQQKGVEEGNSACSCFSACPKLAWLSAKAGGQWWQRCWVTFPRPQGIPLHTDQWDFCHWLQLRTSRREMESERMSRMIWKVWGELRDKGSKVEKVGNVIIKVSDTGNTYVVGKKARDHVHSWVWTKCFIHFWLSSPVETICQDLLLKQQDYWPVGCSLLNWCVFLYHMKSAFIFNPYYFLAKQKVKLLSYCQKLHCMLKGFFFLPVYSTTLTPKIVENFRGILALTVLWYGGAMFGWV